MSGQATVDWVGNPTYCCIPEARIAASRTAILCPCVCCAWWWSSGRLVLFCRGAGGWLLYSSWSAVFPASAIPFSAAFCSAIHRSHCNGIDWGLSLEALPCTSQCSSQQSNGPRPKPAKTARPWTRGPLWIPTWRAGISLLFAKQDWLWGTATPSPGLRLPSLSSSTPYSAMAFSSSSCSLKLRTKPSPYCALYPRPPSCHHPHPSHPRPLALVVLAIGPECFTG